MSKETTPPRVNIWGPRCVALAGAFRGSDDNVSDCDNTGLSVNCDLRASFQPRVGGGAYPSLNYFKSAEWSPDGTTVITDSADHGIRSFVLPQDLLEENDSPLVLTPYSILPSPEPTYATAIYPYYSLQDPSTTIVLSSIRDHPIRLASALAPESLATFSLIHPTTEAFITPHSILYPPELGGSQFLTGSDSLICFFDVSRPGNYGPVLRLATIPSKRKRIVGGGVGMKGIISAMSMNPSGDKILAAGTFSRDISLYASKGSGELIGTFSIAKTDADRRIGGKGITQLIWSPCGRYLYIIERKSHGILIYDIRVTGQLLGWLHGRNAVTNQRLKADITTASEVSSHDIWAGGKDGIIRVWRNPFCSAGEKSPDWQWKAHDDPITSTVLHPMGSVMATCSGQKYYPDYADTDESKDISCHPRGDNSLKIWSL